MTKANMVPVKNNRSYVKGAGSCVNVNDTAYTTRLKRLKAEANKDAEISTLKDEVSELKSLVQQLLEQGKNN